VEVVVEVVVVDVVVVDVVVVDVVVVPPPQASDWLSATRKSTLVTVTWSKRKP
jgi:hypothetical protein